MSYTKGPYKRHFWVVFDNDGNKLADFDVSVENAQLDSQTVIDNANLFVAGPELVEALEDCLDELKAWTHCAKPEAYPNEMIITKTVMDNAQKALTKAKGSQP